MPAGRPRGLDLDPAMAAPVGQEVVTIDDRGRIRIPGWLVADLDWFNFTQGAERYVLGVFEEPERIELRSWAQGSPAVLDFRAKLLQAGNYPAIRLLEDRYRRIEIPKDLRPTLGDGARAHLRLGPDQNSYVYFFRTGDTIEIASTTYRDRVLREASESEMATI